MELDGSVLAVTPIMANDAGAGGGHWADLTTVADDLVTVPLELVALRV